MENFLTLQDLFEQHGIKEAERNQDDTCLIDLSGYNMGVLCEYEEEEHFTVTLTQANFLVHFILSRCGDREITLIWNNDPNWEIDSNMIYIIDFQKINALNQ